MSEDQDLEREHAPTQQKLDKAREQGDIVRSNDLQSAVVIGGFILGFSIFAPPLIQIIGASGRAFLSASDSRTGQAFDASEALIKDGLLSMAPLLGAILFLPGLLVIAYLFATRSFLVTASKLQFKLSRVSVLQNAKQKFGIDGLVEFGKNNVKIAAICLAFGLQVWTKQEAIFQMLWMGAGMSMWICLQILAEMLALLFLISLAMGGGDYLWQFFRHQSRNKMSRKEMTEENKESEGDPHAKQTRRARGQEIALNQMLNDVPGASVVIVNPTHYAVALAWDGAKGTAPRCVAKGVDDVARRIREKAKEAGVPLHSDPPTARAIYATIDIGDEIEPNQYRAVAAAIRFADRMRKLKKGTTDA